MISSVSTLKAHLIRRFPMNIGAVTFISMRGFFYYSCPKIFGDRFTEYAVNIRNNPPPELEVQNLNPWLDQVALPLVIHSLGGGVIRSQTVTWMEKSVVITAPSPCCMHEKTVTS